MARRSFPRRLLIGLASALLALVLLVALAAMLQLTVGSRLLARRLGGIATRALLADGTRLRVSDLAPHGLSGLTLAGVALEVRETDGSWYSWCELESVQLDFSLRELAGRGHRLRAIRIEGAQLHAGSPSAARPALRRTAGEGHNGRGLTGTVGSVHLVEARFERGNGPPALLDLRMGVSIGRGFVACAIDSSRLELPQLGSFAIRGPLEVRGAAVYLEALHVESAGSRIEAAGVVDGRRGARLRLELAPLELGELAPWTGWRLPAGPSWVRGAAELEGRWSDLRLDWDLEARIGVDAIENLTGSGRLSGGSLQVDAVSLDLGGVPLAGDGHLAWRRGERSWGRVRFSEVPLGSFPVLRSQSWLPPGRLSGTVRIGSAGAGGRPFALDVSRGTIAGFRIEPGSFRGSILPGAVVRLDSVRVQTGGARLSGNGSIDPQGGIDLRQTLVVDDLGAFAAMFTGVELAGSGALRLAIIGPLRSPAFSVSGRLDSLVAGDVRLEAIELGLGPGVLGPAISSDIELSARRGRVGRQPLGPLVFTGNWRQRRLRIGNLELAAGGVEAALRGHVAWTDGGVEFRLDELTGRAGGRRWRSLAPFSGGRRAGAWEIEPLTLISDAGTLRASGRVDPRSGRARLELSARALDLGALAAGPGGIPLAGKVDLEIEANGRPDSLAVRYRLAGDGVGAGAFRLERLEMAGALADDVLAIERLVAVRGGRLEATGQLQLGGAVASARGWRRLARRATWEDAQLDLTVASEALDLEAWHGLSGALDRVAGTVGFELALGGTAAAPDGTATIAAEGLVVGDDVLRGLDARLRLHAGWLQVERLVTRLRGSDLEVRGRAPVEVSLLAAPRLDRQAPIGLMVHVDPGDLALAPLITDRVIDASGPVNGWVTVTGSVDAPQYSGEFDVRGASLRPTGREEVLHDLEARVVLGHQAVHLDEVRARGGEEGRLRGSGILHLLDGKVDGYTFDATLDRFPVRATGEYLAALSGTLRWTRGRGFPKPLSQIDARLTVHRLDYLREVMGGGDRGERQPSTWVGRIELDLPRNCWVRNEDLELELKGDLTYERRASGRTLLGALAIVRGHYDLFGHTFRITRGSIDFVDPVRIDPELDVTAETRTPETRIGAAITGRASDRQIVLSADDEDLDQATLWAMLVPTAGGDVPTLVAMTPFIRDFERALSREVPGLSVSFEVHDPEAAQGGMGARVGTYVIPEMFLSAYQGFASTADQDVVVEYQLSDLLFLKGEALRRGGKQGSGNDVEQEYNLNLNFRWEF